MRPDAIVLVVLICGLQSGCSPEDPKPAPVPIPPPKVTPAPAAAQAVEVPEVVAPAELGPQDSPQNVIRGFFAAAETNGVPAMRELSMARIHERLGDVEWVKLWSDYKLTEVGDKAVEKLPPLEGAARTVRVPVVTENREDGEVLKEMISVSFKGEKWYWDDL